ncbi:MAG TPA: GAF domain-containing SpoIIE family protein phosphatase [Solirubrobacteraceae bacterium]|nr:GAF domain-containing SpoIIE family protein phosphatase [Solirubrobacteraceae bacterium]
MAGSKIGIAGGARREGETRVAVASAAGLYILGGTLIGTSFLLPEVSSPAGAAAVAGDAYLTAIALLWAVRRGRSSLGLAWLAELWGIAIITVLCASTGGAASPFALLYFFATGHSAAFQPRSRFALTSLAGLLAYLAPLVYSHVDTNFAAIACVGGVLAVLTTVVLHVALERMRADRRRLELLIAATAKLDNSLDPQQTLRRIATTALPELAELCVIDLVDEDGAITNTVAAAVDPRVAARVEATRPSERPEKLAGHPVARVLTERSSKVIDDLADAPALGEAIQTAGILPGDDAGSSRSATVVPMVARGRMLGVMTFVHPGRPQSGRLRILEDLTGRAALAYDNARLYAERARVAQTLRSSLMPAALPSVPGLELRSYFRPLGAGNEVGGDFYDVFSDRDGCWLVVGDVCGKGAEAAVLTAFLRHTAGAYARDGSSPATVLARVNAAMLEHDFEGRFATALLARMEHSPGGIAVTLAAAGHPAALVTRAGGRTEEFGGGGTLLGIFPDARIAEATTTLRVGDSLALYTDGLAEAQAPARTLSSGEMISALDRTRPESAEQAIAALLGLLDLSQGARDDIAILAVRVAAAGALGVRAA